MKLKKIPIDEATNAQLLFFAKNVVGLDVSKGMNNAMIRAKIEAAMPGTTEVDIEAPDEDSVQAQETVAAAEPKPGVQNDSAIPAGREGAHFRYDPKVRVQVSPTADKTRAQDVQIAVNGDVVIIKRGEAVDIPYRHYLALKNAKEKQMRDTDELNPVTQMPVKEWVELPSYEFSVLKMPSDEEIADYHKRTDALATV